MRSVMLLLASDVVMVRCIMFCIVICLFLPSMTLQKVKRDDLWISRRRGLAQ